MNEMILGILGSSAATAIFVSVGFAFTTSKQIATLCAKFDAHTDRDAERKTAVDRLCSETHKEVDRRLENLEQTRTNDTRISSGVQ